MARHPILQHYRDTILEGMAEALWAHAWEHAHGTTTSDQIPEPPRAAKKAATALAGLYEAGPTGQGDLVDLYGFAQEADMGEPFSFSEESSASRDSKVMGLERASKMSDAYEFGEMLANMALDNGLSWFDKHAKFELEQPRFTCAYDGENLNWSGGYDDVREVSGRLGRIVLVNADDHYLWKHTYVLAFGAYGDTILMAYANSLDNALDECIDWLAERAPGHIIDAQVEEAYHQARNEGLSEEEAQERAEEDTTVGGNYGQHIISAEWSIVAEDPTEEQLAEIALHRNRGRRAS
jgi:hypothetical protein